MFDKREAAIKRLLLALNSLQKGKATTVLGCNLLVGYLAERFYRSTYAIDR